MTYKLPDVRNQTRGLHNGQAEAAPSGYRSSPHIDPSTNARSAVLSSTDSEYRPQDMLVTTSAGVGIRTKVGKFTTLEILEAIPPNHPSARAALNRQKSASGTPTAKSTAAAAAGYRDVTSIALTREYKIDSDSIVLRTGPSETVAARDSDLYITGGKWIQLVDTTAPGTGFTGTTAQAITVAQSATAGYMISRYGMNNSTGEDFQLYLTGTDGALFNIAADGALTVNLDLNPTGLTANTYRPVLNATDAHGNHVPSITLTIVVIA